MTTPTGPTALSLPGTSPALVAPGARPDSELHEPPGDPVCSARRCRDHAEWALRWNNPRLHTPERRKTWLACDAHREHLSEFLSLRGFLRDVEPMADVRVATA
jgi:hypothetical protein